MTDLIAARFDECSSHFTCGNQICGQWWSIDEFGTATGWLSDMIYCPRCGRKQSIAPWRAGDGVPENPA